LAYEISLALNSIGSAGDGALPGRKAKLPSERYSPSVEDS
jgi:hypothetical protein